MNKISSLMSLRDEMPLFILRLLSTDCMLSVRMLASLCHAFSIGYYSVGFRRKILTSPKPFTQTKIPDALPMAMATKAKIMEISSPPDDFTPSMKTMFMSQDKVALRRWLEDQKSCQIDTLQQYFYRRNGTRNGNGAKGEKREAVSRLMTVGTIFAVVDEKVCSKTIDKFDMKLRSSIRFYKIVEIETEMGILQQYNANMSMSGGNEDFCWISPETQLVLLPKEDSKLVHVSRMTQFSSTWSFSQSVQNSSTSTYTYSSFVRKAWSRPSLVNVVQSIFSTGSLGLNLCRNNVGSNSSLESHLIHVIGNEDDHVKLCLDAAADSGTRQHSSKKQQGARVLSAGIRAAFTVARRSTPCIVHIRLDQEIIDTDDTEARHDEESRLLSCLREASLDVYKEMEGVDVPPVLVVISTEKEFEHGPLSSSIIYDSVSIESPNESYYARENWNDNDSFDEVKHELLGRSANEIYFWGKEFRRKKRDMMCSHQPLPTSSFSAKEMLMSIMNCSASRVTMFHSSSKKLTSDLIPNVKWEDIGGLSHVRSEIIDAIELPLQHPDLFKGSSRRSGILFFGPPGSGKTLVAKAVASECGLPFLSIKGPELLGSYVGESESNIRAAFASAREAAADSVHENSTGAAILFFDEIDSLAPRRGELGDGGGVMERVVSTLLAEMDKDVDPHENPGQVFVIGATNRPDLLDPSLLRPGRFDRIVYLGLAKSREDRIQILAAQTRKFQFENGVDAFAMASKVIDAIPSSMSGADFSAVASGALMLALQRLCDEVDNEVSSNSSPDSNIEDVVAMWPEERLVPKVKVEDFIAAAEKIHPSVSDDDIQKYEAMRNEYCALGRH